MTKELLQQSIDLEKKIHDLKVHYEQVKTEKELPYETDKARIHVEPNFENTQRRLLEQFLPVSLAEFMEMYLSKVEKEIKKIEKQFEKL